jgi:hypothetical protein
MFRLAYIGAPATLTLVAADALAPELMEPEFIEAPADAEPEAPARSSIAAPSFMGALAQAARTAVQPAIPIKPSIRVMVVSRRVADSMPTTSKRAGSPVVREPAPDGR